jgi:hypothetical protein
MYILLFVTLFIGSYSDPLEVGLWSYTRQSCQQNCVALNRGYCDQQQILAANTPEKVNEILKERIHPIYNCEEYEMGDKVGYERIDRHKYKCYYMDPELSIEDTANTCSIFQPANNLCPCSNNVDIFMSPEPTNQPTSQPTMTNQPTSQPTITFQPTSQPTMTNRPTSQPTMTNRPTSQPTMTNQPTSQPTMANQPTNQPYVDTISMAHKKQSIYIDTTVIILVVSGLVLIIIIRLLILLYCKYCRRIINMNRQAQPDKIIPVTISDVIPIVEAYVVEYPQPSAPPMSFHSRNISEKQDIEMGVIKK